MEQKQSKAGKAMKKILNGNTERVAFWGIVLTILIYLIKASVGTGSYTNQIEVNRCDIIRLRKDIDEKTSTLTQIQKDIAEIKANQKIIMKMMDDLYFRHNKKF